MLAQSLGGVAFYLICAVFGTIILGMAANAWRQFGQVQYRRMALAGGVLFLGRTAGLALLWSGLPQVVGCQEWALESLTLAVFLWAFLYSSFARPRWASLFLVGSAITIGILLLLCAFPGMQSLPFSELAPWFALLLVLNAFALVQWIRYRPQFSLWLVSAFVVSSLGAVTGVLGFPAGALLAYLAALPLFVVETYQAVLTGFGTHSQELQAAGEQNLQRTQEMVFLLELSRAITASLDLVVILERVSESIAHALNADWAYVLLPVDGDPERLTVAARYGGWGRRWLQDSQLSRRVVISLSDFSLIRHAILRQRQILANLPDDYEQFESLHDRLARPQSGPALIQPMLLQDRLLGVLLLGRVDLAPRRRRASERSFSEVDAELCQVLAGQVAAAIENARLYQEVTDRIRQLAKLLVRREKEVSQFQAILESIDGGVLVVRDGGEVMFANTAAVQILGVSREELHGATIGPLYAGLLQAGQQEGDDLPILQWGQKQVMGSLVRVRMPDGTLLGYVALLRDVTRQRQTEGARAEWMANVVHELQSMLTSTKEALERMAANAAPKPGPQHDQLLDLIKARTERMLGIVGNLTILSEREADRLQMEPQLVDLRHVIEEAVQAVCLEQGVGRLELSTNLPANLDRAWGDPQQLRQILDGLLGNAVRSTPEGGRIGVWAAQAYLEDDDALPQKYLVVSIRDGGAGLALEEQDRISEKLYRIDNLLWEGTGGTGAQLAVIKNLVEAHGGRIWVESKPGSGTTFSFTIPVSADA